MPLAPLFSAPTDTSRLPSPSKVGSSDPSALRRITPSPVLPPPSNEMPATRILASGCTMTARATSSPTSTDTIALPSPSKVASSEPSAFRRTTLNSRWAPFQEEPATRILPSGCRTAAWTTSPLPMGTVARPSPSKVASADPSAFRRITLRVRLPPAPEYPTTRILPSGCSITAWAMSSPLPTGRITLPSPSKVASSDPSAFSLTRLKSYEPLFAEYPATRILPSGDAATLWPKSSKPPTGTIRVPLPAAGAKVGASLTGVTARLAVSLAALNAVVPPVAPIGTYCPSPPVLRSHARKVIASFSVPFRSPKGSIRMRAVGPSSSASSFVAPLIAAASTASQVVPPSRLNCQVPRRVFKAVMAMASTAPPSASTMLPFTTRSAMATPEGSVSPSSTLPRVGEGPASSTGAAFAPAMFTVVLPKACIAPPLPCAPALPSSNVQSITTEAGGVPLVLAYAICRIAAFTSNRVAPESKVSTSVPPPFVVTAPIVVPPTVSAAPWVSAPSEPVAENTSCALAAPLRDSVSVAPA